MIGSFSSKLHNWLLLCKALTPLLRKKHVPLSAQNIDPNHCEGDSNTSDKLTLANPDFMLASFHLHNKVH